MRRRTLRRWALPSMCGGLLIAALTSAVSRGEDGRRLSQRLDRLEAEETILRDHLAGQIARADSLAALPRIERAAGEIGLRQAADGEVFHLSEGVGVDGERTGSDARVDGDG